MMERVVVNNREKKRRWLNFWPLYVIVALMIVSIPFLVDYFTERVFYLDGQQYKLYESRDRTMIYRSSSPPEVIVQTTEEGKMVTIEGESYTISEQTGDYGRVFYRVTYPDDNWYRVEDPNGHGNLQTFDRFGNWQPMVHVYVNGERRSLHDDPTFTPASLVTSAYPEYHETRGVPGLTILSYLLFILGWCMFRYKGFQTVLFHLNFYQLWVENPEPTDFYYFMTKVSGMIIMGGAVVLFFFSLYA